jgi:hypothetical protein
MRDTQKMTEVGFLGAHLPLLRVGDAQSVVFMPTNSGPWYLSPEHKEIQHCDRATRGSKLIKRSKKQLLEPLREVGVTPSNNNKAIQRKSFRLMPETIGLSSMNAKSKLWLDGRDASVKVL